jgi:hypothetical protein
MRHGARSPSSGVASERDLQLQAEDPTLSAHQRLEQRVEELEAGPRVGLKQLPMQALQERLLQNWQPEGDNLLLPQSVGPDALQAVPQARVYLTSATNHTSTGNWQKVPLDTSTFDLGADAAHFDNTNDRLLIHRSGLYLVQGSIIFAANGTGIRSLQLAPNGSTPSTGTGTIDTDAIAGSAAAGATLRGSTIWRFNAGDYVELYGFQSSGGNLAYSVGSPRLTWLSIAWLSN